MCRIVENGLFRQLESATLILGKPTDDRNRVTISDAEIVGNGIEQGSIPDSLKSAGINSVNSLIAQVCNCFITSLNEDGSLLIQFDLKRDCNDCPRNKHNS